MALSTTTSKVILISTGVNPFQYPFRILDEAHLEVLVAGVLQTIATHYTVTGVNDPNGGTINFTAGNIPVASTQVILNRVVPPTQEVDIPSAPAKFPEAAIEEELDKLTMLHQQQVENIDRSLKIPITLDPTIVLTEMPDPVVNAGKVVTYATNGFGASEFSPTDFVNPLSVKGDLVTRTATTNTRLPVGPNDSFLTPDSAVSTGVKWAAQLTGQGDLVTRTASTLTRLGLGGTHQSLGNVNNSLAWRQESWSQGNCRMSIDGFNHLKLFPYNGNQVVVFVGSQWIQRVLDIGGITHTGTGLANNTLYYIYLFDNAGNLNLEASTTAYAIEGTHGFMTKTADISRLLVGMAYHTTGVGWADAEISRYVRTWFNDPGVLGYSEYSVDRTTSSTTLVELNTEFRVIVVSWAGEEVNVTVNGQAGVTSDGLATYVVSTDGTTNNQRGSTQNVHASGTPEDSISYGLSTTTLTEGLSTFYQLVAVSAGTMTAEGTTANGRMHQFVIGTGRK